jgi:hypothetical protein
MTNSVSIAVLGVLVATGTAGAQTLIAPEPVEAQPVIAAPLPLTPAQRTTIYRTIIPQSRGRAPIIHERIVTEPVAPAPVVRQHVVVPQATYAYEPSYTYDDDTYAPPAAPRRVVTAPAPADAYQDYAYAVGSTVAPSARLAPLPRAVVAEVPAMRPYRYMVWRGHVLLIDPVTSTVVADVTQ